MRLGEEASNFIEKVGTHLERRCRVDLQRRANVREQLEREA